MNVMMIVAVMKLVIAWFAANVEYLVSIIYLANAIGLNDYFDCSTMLVTFI